MQGHDFYSAYLSNHFKIKSRNASYFLNMKEEDIAEHINKVGLSVNSIQYLKTIKIDLVQEFYQSVETLFNLIYCLQDYKNQLIIPDKLVNVKIADLHTFINKFKSYDNSYSYLNEIAIEVNGHDITNLQYLFYFGSCLIDQQDDARLTKILNETNFKGLALTLTNLAKLFNQEAHNSIKHGLRCSIISKFDLDIVIPDDIKALPDLPAIADEHLKWTGDDDMLLYYTKEKGENTATQVLIPVHYEQIIYHEDGISKLLSNLLTHREALINGDGKTISVNNYYFDYDTLSTVEFKHKTNFESIRMGASK